MSSGMASAVCDANSLAAAFALHPVLSLLLHGIPGRSSYVYRERFNLAAQQGHVLGEEALLVPAAPVGPGGLFAAAWRNYIRSVFKKGYMYRVSCKPSVILYIAENKTLAGKENRSYEGEALGRKMAVVFFQDMPGPGDLVKRVQNETMCMQQVLLSVAEILQTIGVHGIPADPNRPAAHMEQILEAQYQHLELTASLAPKSLLLLRRTCSLSLRKNMQRQLWLWSFLLGIAPK